MPTGPKRRSLKERLLERVEVSQESGCWLWTGATIRSGSPTSTPLFYGVIGEGGSREKGAKQLLVHRASWMVHKGEIPPGMQVLHRCDTPLCVNPEHLFLGTASDNMRDCYRKGRMPQAYPSSVSQGRAAAIHALHAAGWKERDIADVMRMEMRAVTRVIRSQRFLPPGLDLREGALAPVVSSTEGEANAAHESRPVRL